MRAACCGLCGEGRRRRVRRGCGERRACMRNTGARACAAHSVRRGRCGERHKCVLSQWRGVRDEPCRRVL